MNNLPDPPPGDDPIQAPSVVPPVPPPMAGPPSLPPRPMAPGFGMPFGPPSPPPWMQPPGPPQKERSLARSILVTLATAVFSLSLGLNVYLFMASGVLNSGGVQSHVLVAGDPLQTIAVLPLTGLVDDDMASTIETFLREVEADPQVRGVVVEINTPGGLVSSSDQIFQRLHSFKQTRNIPLVVSMGGMATSGGYYISCAADHIVAQPTTLTGNIGVLMTRFNMADLADRWGVSETTLTAPKEGYKNAGSMFRKPVPQEEEYLQGLINTAYARFKTVVNQGRAGKLKQSIEKIADGRVYTTGDAMKLGLVDEEGYTLDASAAAAKLAKLTKPHVVRYSRTPGLWEMLSAKSPTPPAKATQGLNVSLDRKLLDELSTPRPLYLWRGQ